jgi:hypothetical protein
MKQFNKDIKEKQLYLYGLIYASFEKHVSNLLCNKFSKK